LRWFKHDSDANIDAKLEKLIIKYGMQGYGLYWYCLEMIAMNVSKINLSFELEHDSEVLSYRTGIHSDVIEEMMKFMISLGLFESSRGKITCLKMLKRIDSSITSNKQFRTMIDVAKNSHGKVMIKSREIMTESCKKRIEENRREKKRTEKNASAKNIFFNEWFEKIWKKYPKPIGKKAAERHFKKTIKNEKDLIRLEKALNNYINSRTVKDGFVQNGSTWFNNWEDWVNFEEKIKPEDESEEEFLKRMGCEV